MKDATAVAENVAVDGETTIVTSTAEIGKTDETKKETISSTTTDSNNIITRTINNNSSTNQSITNKRG